MLFLMRLSECVSRNSRFTIAIQFLPDWANCASLMNSSFHSLRRSADSVADSPEVSRPRSGPGWCVGPRGCLRAAVAGPPLPARRSRA
eukprot:2113647-Heterocapsa_arctica.AAC.1